jgi:hypothetical protein
MSRAVVIARTSGRTVTLRPARGCTVSDVVELVRRAAVPNFQRTRAGVVLGASRLPDVEALARSTGVVVTRQGTGNAPDAPPAPVAPSVPLVAGLHGCAGPVCRVPGCRPQEGP